MIKHKVVICDHIHSHGIELLEKERDIELINAAHLPKDELLKILGDADIAITRSSTDVGQAFLDAAKRVRAIVRAGVGVDNVDIDACSRQGVIVMNVPTANTIAAVELTMAHILSCCRNFPDAHNQLKNQRIWKREDWYGTELKDKKLGVIGFGNIGSRVALRAKAFEMEVIAFDPYIKPSKATDHGIIYTTCFDDILSCDIITIHTPKNKETTNIIGKNEIAKMKEGVILINCARGNLYNEEALYEGLKSKKIRWAGLDVFSKEPATSNPLLDLPNLYVTQHIGANTLESQEKIATQAAQAAIEAARGSSYPNALNLPVKESEIPALIKPYLELTQKLGFFATQANKGAINSLKLITEGEIQSHTDSLMTFALVGALNASVGDKVNYVNAPYVAKERGIELKKETRNPQGGYKNRVILELTTEKETLTLSGTVFDESVQRISNINGFALDIEPKGKMILFRNTDTPGVIGRVGTTLADHQINIADFRLGRNHGQALALIVVDDEVQPKTLEELRAIPACLGVRYVVI